MNKIFNLATVLLILVGVASCKKDSKGVSGITNYIVYEMKGDEAMTIAVGDPFTDPGVVAHEGEEDVTSKTKVSGTVDTNTPGVYTLTYTTTNKDGYSSSVRRYVGVVTDAAGKMDISGKYKRNAGVFGTATIVKTKYSGLYINDNPGGIVIDPGTNEVYIYMFQTEPGVVSAPSQSSSVGEFACINGSYNAAGKSYTWSCINSGYGNTARTFNKL